MKKDNGSHENANNMKDVQSGASLSFFTSMRGKILGLFLAFSIIPSLLAVGFSYQQISQALEDRIKNELQRSVRLQAAKLDRMFDERIKDLRVVAATDEVRSMEPQRVYRTIVSFDELWKRYVGITIYRPNGYAVAESIRTPEETNKAYQNISDREYFQKAIRGQENISDVIMTKSGEGLVMMVAVPIYKKGIIGVAVAAITTDAIAISLDESRVGWTGNVYLVHREGYFISPSLELRADTFGVREALAGNQGVSIYHDYRGREVVGAYVPVPRTGWGLLIEQETEDALASVRRLRNISILVGLIFAGLAAGMAVFVSGGMIKNVAKLTHVAGELKGGNLGVRADVTSTDELGQLSESFNTMADRIGTLVSELEQQVAEKVAANEELQREIAERKQAEESLRESEIRYHTLFDGVPAALYRTTPAGQFLDVNLSMVQMFGLPDRESLLAMNVADVYVNPEDRKRWKTLMEQEGIVRDFEFQIRRVDGTSIWVNNTGRAVKDEQGQILDYEGSLEDITERKQAEEALKDLNISLEQRVKERTEELAHYIEELEERNREIGLLSQMGDLLQACKKVEESYIIIAQSVSQLFPYYSGGLYIFNASRNLLDGVSFWGEKPPGEEMFPPDDCWALRRGRSHVATDMKTDLKCHHTGEISVSYMCTPMMALGEVLGMLHLRVNPASIKQGVKYFNDSQQQVILNLVDQVGMAIANLRLHEMLRNLSIRDPLTGLFNRRFMEESLERELLRARRNSSSVGIIMCDLDYFKGFNDTYGHEVGDAFLKELGKFLQSNIRASDIACRFGGEEFVLILPETLLKMAYQRAEYLREGVKHIHIQHGQQSLGPITLSLGVAMFPDHGPTAEEVLKVADTALYRAKHEGRDRVCGT